MLPDERQEQAHREFGIAPSPVTGGSAKRAPEYPGCFRDDCEAVTYFEKYFDWYNHRHYHSGIDYVTPAQAHQGLRDSIVHRRTVQQQAQRQRRRAETRKSVHNSKHYNRPPALLPVA